MTRTSSLSGGLGGPHGLGSPRLPAGPPSEVLAGLLPQSLERLPRPAGFQGCGGHEGRDSGSVQVASVPGCKDKS